MNQEQIAAVYTYLINNSDDPQVLLNHLNGDQQRWDNEIDNILYLPMYSMGLDAETIDLRIDWLINNGWDLQRLVQATKIDRNYIAEQVLVDGSKFRMPNRIDELIERAQQLSQYDHDEIVQALAPPEYLQGQDLLEPITLLQKFTGISLTSAIRILMELDWGVVIPDKYLCRFLSRIGGELSGYIQSPPNNDKPRSEAVLFLLAGWRNICYQLDYRAEVRHNKGVNFPDFGELTPVQIDYLIKWYTQKVALSDTGWRPNPICTREEPHCQNCIVPDCAGRELN
jgi:hypothetical protein